MIPVRELMRGRLDVVDKVIRKCRMIINITALYIMPDNEIIDTQEIRQKLEKKKIKKK